MRACWDSIIQGYFKVRRMSLQKIINRGIMAAVAMISLSLTACDDTTDGIGASLTANMDRLNVIADTFAVGSRTVIADSVYTRNIYGYIGQVKDPETGAYITGNFMAQVHVLKNFTFPSIDSLVSKTADGKAYADSCELRLLRTTFYGDSLSQMKLTVHELELPMKENTNFYSNFDPIKEGYIRTDGLQQSRSYTQADLAFYNKNNPLIRVKLNDPYTDKEGKTYRNYGTYLMQKFYEDKSLYKNAYTFNEKLCPGFYFETTGGVGSMSCIEAIQLVMYFRLTSNDSTYTASTSLLGTEEVLQNTTILNDKTVLEQLAADNTCTYVKAPAGLFTELTLPVDQIMSGHENDTLNTVKLELPRLNNTTDNSYALKYPTTLLMLPADSLYSFFENHQLADNKTSYIGSTYVTKGQTQTLTNAYHFNNISGLVNAMYEAKKKGLASSNWNKVIIIPVTASYSTDSNGNVILTKVVHQMDMTTARLVGGSQNPHSPLTVSVIYSKFDK